MKKGILLIFAVTGLMLFNQCGKTDGISGTGTLIGNPSAAVSGSLYYKDGLPASNVNVHIRKQNSLAITQASNPAQLIDTATVMTDNNGVFTFEATLDSGLYAIEAISGNNSVFIDSIHIAGLTTPVVLPPDTLRSAGAFKGIVKLATSDDPGNVYVLVFGINRFAQVKSDGSFVFYPLAQGVYNIQIISSLHNYDVLDINNVSVLPSDTTNLGILELPYSGIPIPKDVTLSYDTMKQIVTVHWSTPATGVVKSFNIYKKDLRSSMTFDKPINSITITGNSFCDSHIIQDHDYSYCVAIVDTFESEGPKSVEVNCKAVSAFIRVPNASFDVESFGDIDFSIDTQNNIWVADNHENKVSKFDSAGNLLSSWGITGCPPDEGHAEIGMDLQKNIYLSNSYGRGVLKYDSAGTLIWSMKDSSLIVYRFNVASDGCLYCKVTKKIDASKGIYQGYIYKYNSDGTFNKSWKVNSHIAMEGILIKNGKVYCAGINNISLDNNMDDNVIDIYDTSGTYLSSIHVRKKGDPSGMSLTAIAIDNNGILYCTESNSKTVRIFDKNSEYIGKFQIASDSGGPYELSVLDNGTILIQLGLSTLITMQKQINQY